MTTNFLNPDKWVITVGTTDITSLVLEGDGAYSSCLDQSGLAIITGALTIGRSLNSSIDIDDRSNTLWQTGQTVSIVRQSDNLKVPVIGSTLIETSLYDINSQLNNIDITCQLGLKNKWTPGEMGICVNLNEGVTKDAAIAVLLDRAGVPHNVTDVSGSLKKSIVLNENQSFVGLAGQIAYSGGGFLYQNKEGIVVFKKFTDKKQNSYDFIAPVELQRLSNDASIIKDLKIIGNKITYVDTPASQTLSTVKTFGESGRTAGSSSRRIYADSRVIIEKTREYRDGKFASSTTVTSQYEAFNPYATNIEATLEDCVPPDEAKIKSRRTVVKQRYGDAFAEFLAVIETAIDPATPSSEDSVVISSVSTETWDYPANYNANNAEGVINAGYTKRGQIPRGITYPKIGDKTLGRGGTTRLGIVNETLLWTSDIQDDRYYFDSTTWSKKSKIYKPYNALYPNSIIEDEQNLGIVLTDVISKAVRPVISESRTAVDGSAPSLATFPALRREIIDEETLEIVIEGAIDGARGSVNLGDFWDGDSARLYIPAWQTLVNSKTKGITTQHAIVDEFFNIDFLDNVTTSDCDRFYNYLADNIGVAFNQTEAILGVNGIYDSYGDFSPTYPREDWVDGTIVITDIPGQVELYKAPTIILADEAEVTCDALFQQAFSQQSQTIEGFESTDWDCAETCFITVAGSSPVEGVCGTSYECTISDGEIISPLVIATACGDSWECALADGDILTEAFIGSNCGNSWEQGCMGLTDFALTINSICGDSWECAEYDGSVFANTINNACGDSWECTLADGAAFELAQITTACGDAWECAIFDGDITSDKIITTNCGSTWECVEIDSFIAAPAEINTVCGTAWECLTIDSTFEETITTVCGYSWECALADGDITADTIILTTCGTAWECALFDGNTTIDTSNISVLGVDNGTDILALTWDDGTGTNVYLVDEEPLP